MKFLLVGCVLLAACLSVQATTLYSCNFDKNDCSVVITEENIQSLKISSFLQDKDYYFTDSTSISANAANGKKCQIPFNLNSQQYFHCTPAGQCQTSSGLSKCADGRFMNGIADDSIAGAYFSRARFPQFNLPERGNYTVNFKAFMFCDGAAEDCSKVNEEIILFINDAQSGDNIDSLQMNLVSFNGLKSWKTISEKFTFSKGSVYLEFDIGRFSTNKATIYYGIDDIEVIDNNKNKASWASFNMVTMFVAFVVSVLLSRTY